MKAKIVLFVIFFLLISLAVFSEPERITTTKEGSQQVREFYAIRSDPNMQIGGDRDKDRRRIADEFLRLQCPCNIEGISYAISFGFTCIGNDVYEEFESTFPYPNSNDCVRCPLEGTYQFVPHYVKFMKKCDPDKCVYGKCIKESVKDKQEKDHPEPPPPPSTKNVVSTDIISECGDGIIQPGEDCDVSAGLDGDLCPDGKKCKECKCVDEMVNDYYKKNKIEHFDIPRTYSLFPSGGGLINLVFEQIFQQTIRVPGFKLDSYKIFTNFAKNDPFTISTNFAQKYPKGALINLQPNNYGNYVPQINNFESSLENNAPAVLIKPITSDTSDDKKERNSVFGAKIILRNSETNGEDITFIADNKIWAALVNLAETSEAFQRLDAQSWPVFVGLLEQNMVNAGVELVQTPYTIVTTGTPLEENKDYRFDASRTGENSFRISTTLLNSANSENSAIIATVVDAQDNTVISFEPRVLSSEETYTDNRLYEEFGSGSFTVDIEIVTQQTENSFEHFMNRIEQRTLPSRFESMVYSAMS